MAEQVVAEYRLQVDQAVKGLDKLQNETRQLGKDFNKTGSDGKKSMNEVGNSANNLGKSFKNLGTQILSAFGLVGSVYTFIAAIKNGVSAAAEFEKQMSIVKALTNATDKEFQQLQASAKQLGSSTKFTATQVGQLQEEFAKLGFTTDEIIAASEATLALASAAGTDLATAASVAGQVIRAFGLDAEETIRVVDVMALSFTKSALDISNFEEAMKYVAPIAKVANIDLETTVALLSKLADAGLRGSIAGTGLKNLFSKLADENSDLSKQLGYSVKNSEDLFRALSDLKNANIDLTTATELTDERSKAAFLILRDGAEDIRTLAREYDNVNGFVFKMSETMEDNVIGAVTKLSSAWEGLMIQIAGSNGYLRTFVELMTKYVNLTQKVFASDKDRLEQDIASNAESGKRNALTMKQINILKEVNMALGANEDALNASFSAKISNNIDNLNKKIQEQKDIIKDPYVTDVNLRAAQLLLARYEAELDATVKTQEKFNESLSESGGAADAVNVYVRSIAQLQEELKKLKEDFKNVEIGSQQWFDLIEKMFNKTEELNDANEDLAYRLAVLDGAFDKYEDIETKGIDDFTKSVEKASAALKKAKEEAQIKSLQLTNDEFIDPSLGFPGITSEDLIEPNAFDEALKEWNQYFNSVSQLADAFNQISQAQAQAQINELNRQLDEGLISREEYDKQRREILNEQAEQQKGLAIFEATINGLTAVVNAYSTDPTGILAGITAAIVAAQIAAIAATPVPQYAKGVIALQGAGTETSDSIHAKLSKGESVMTAAETKQYKDELWAIRRGNFEDLIMTKYVKPMIDESLFKGFADMGRSAQLNGITANLKDHNILHGLDRLRQSQQQGFQFLAAEQRKLFSNKSRGGYRA